MGNAKIWLYPAAAGTITEIDLGEPLSDLQFMERVDESITEGLTGELSTTRFNARAMVRLINERFPGNTTAGAALARRLFLVRNHLKAGGLIGVAEDADKAVAGFLRVPSPRGDTVVAVDVQPWPYNATATLAVGDEIELVGSQPRVFREFCTMGSTFDVAAPTNITLSESTQYDYQGEGAEWVLFRHRGFWPLLRLPKEGKNQAVLTHDHRISYTFDVELEEAIDILTGFADPDVGGVVSTTVVTGSRPSMAEIVDRIRGDDLDFGVGQGWGN